MLTDIEIVGSYFDDNDFFLVLSPLSPHGIRGAISFFSHIGVKALDLKLLYDSQGKKYQIKIAQSGKKIIGYLEGVTDRNLAECFESDLFGDKNTTEKLGMSEQELCFLSAVDMSVRHDTKELGSIIGTDNFGAGDLLEMKIGNKEIYYPFNQDYVTKIDFGKRALFVNERVYHYL